MAAMREYEVAIGLVVLALITVGLLYFKFPEQVKRFLEGPSHLETYYSITSSVDSFNAETEMTQSQLSNSWTMKPYTLIDHALKRTQYASLLKSIKEERDALAKETIKSATTHATAADRIVRELDANKSLKASHPRINTAPVDKQIERLTLSLEEEKKALFYILETFSQKRRSLNQDAFREWFIRSVFVSLLIALTATALLAFITSQGASKEAHASSTHHLSRFLSRFSRPLFQKPPPISALTRQPTGQTLTESMFSSTIHTARSAAPPSIATLLKRLPKSKSAQALAAILGAHPNAPASHSHHSNLPGGLIGHTANALTLSEAHLTMLPDPKIGPVAILAHDMGKILTLESNHQASPHDIPSADILASLPELKEEFDEITARSLVLAVRHQHSAAEIPLNAPPLTHTILKFIKTADHGAAAQESREAAEKVRLLKSKIVESFSFLVSDFNINGSNGGSAEGYLSDGTLFLLKEPLKQRLLNSVNAPDGPVFKGQDPVWNEIAQALCSANLIAKRIAEREAGERSCLFTIKTPRGQEKAIALPASNIIPALKEKWLGANIAKIEIV